jgi:hypothetical protein
MKKAVLFVGLLVLATMGTASAAFNTDATEFAKLMLNNTAAQMQQTLSILMILDKASSNSTDLFQNLWGIAYGGMVLASINNQITGTALEAILNEDYTADMTYYGHDANEKLYDVVGYAISDLGNNADQVFGDPEGTHGLAELLYAQYYVLADPNDEFDYDYLQAYATNLAKLMYAGVEFFINLAQAIDEAFNPA